VAWWEDEDEDEDETVAVGESVEFDVALCLRVLVCVGSG